MNRELLQQCYDALMVATTPLPEDRSKVIAAIKTLKAELAKTEPTKGELVGYTAFGSYEGDPIALFHHAGNRIDDVKSSVMDKSREEGFKGTFEERMKELGWTIEPLYALPAKRTPVVEGQLFRRVLKSKSSFPQYEPDVYEKIPVQRVPLSDEEIEDIWAVSSDPDSDEMSITKFTRAIENAVYEKLGIK